MLKKGSLVSLLLILIGVLTACTTEEPLSDTTIVYNVKDGLVLDITEPITSDITLPTTENESVILEWSSSKPEYLTDDGTVTRPSYAEGDQAVQLSAEISLNDAVAIKVFNITVKAENEDTSENPEINTDYTDALAMDFTYDGLSFQNDGVGEVDLVRCVDGDTAIFQEGSFQFSVRFLGIDTPESTYRFDPWGKASAAYTCEQLENADTLVLEADTSTERTDGNGRYLAWVWYDGRLLNLELIELAYSSSKGAGSLKYENTLYQAELKTQVTERRIWGEDDPDFDYSLDGVQITMEELVINQSNYEGRKVVIIGTVSRKIGEHPYLQSGEYGIYLYTGFTHTQKLEEGNEVRISAVVLTYFNGSPQLTSFARENTFVLSTGNTVEPTVKTVDEISDLDLGLLLQLNNLTVTSIDLDEEDAFTITAEDSEGNTITIRRDAAVDSDITPDLFSVGTTFDIVAPLSKYYGNYQIMVAHLDDVTFK